MKNHYCCVHNAHERERAGRTHTPTNPPPTLRLYIALLLQFLRRCHHRCVQNYIIVPISSISMKKQTNFKLPVYKTAPSSLSGKLIENRFSLPTTVWPEDLQFYIPSIILSFSNTYTNFINTHVSFLDKITFSDIILTHVINTFKQWYLWILTYLKIHLYSERYTPSSVKRKRVQ